MFIAKVIFPGPIAGGRETPPLTGYHPQIKAGDLYTSCRIMSVDGNEVFDLDVEHLVLLELLLPEEYAECFAAGNEVTFFEGSHQVGSGIILDVL
jgi:hypothetical protein